jgi:hypothetical protein
MKLLLFSFAIGLAAVAVCGALLWVLLPLLFFVISHDSDAWLGLFPLAVALPTLLFGGFAAGRVLGSHRFAIGFSVGLAATTLAASFVEVAGQVWFLVFVVILGGFVAAVGAHFSGRGKVAP